MGRTKETARMSTRKTITLSNKPQVRVLDLEAEEDVVQEPEECTYYYYRRNCNI